MNPITNSNTFLPPEILVYIFSHLSIETLAITVRVCQQWYSCINSDDIWKPIFRTEFPEDYKVISAIKDNSGFKVHFKNHVFSIISVVLANSEVTLHGHSNSVRIFSEEFIAGVDSKKPLWKQVKTIRAFVNTPNYYDGHNLQTCLWSVCEAAYPDQGCGSQNLRTVKILLMCGANPNYTHNFYCPTALFLPHTARYQRL